MAHTTLTTSSLLNIPVVAATVPQVLKQIEDWVFHHTKTYVCVAAAHLLVKCQDNPVLRKGVQAAGMVVPDGQPLVWMLKLFGFNNSQRIYGPDLMLELCSLAERKKWSIFLVGGAKNQGNILSQKLLKRFPQLQIADYVETPTRPIPVKHDQDILARINATKPKIVFVGLGCPNQELWMIRNRDKIEAPVLIGVGAAFDFISGKVHQAPPWMRKNGLEWLFRLSQDPVRLWRRYTLTNARFAWMAVRQLTSARHRRQNK
jgi:N-acetylglucosaminyldiphosphoundecaprenol N-acetyl-beta-D-mannosaminyltransferase